MAIMTNFWRAVLIAVLALLVAPQFVAADPDNKKLRGVKGERPSVYGSNFQKRKLAGNYPMKMMMMGMGKSKGGKGKGKGGGGGGGKPKPHPPTRLLVLLEAFQPTSVATVPVTQTDPVDIQELGTVFIFNSNIFSSTDFAEENVVGFVSGTCTRTQALDDTDPENVIVGGGSCAFTYTVDDGTYGGSFQAAGEMYDIFNNTLSVTGGTENFNGADGTVLLIPVYTEGSTDIDVFTGAAYYEMDAALYLPHPPLDHQYAGGGGYHSGY